jgi:hypothetical protein
MFARTTESHPVRSMQHRTSQLKAHDAKSLPPLIEEALRLGVVSGWYSTKVSGTFVSGPHDTEADCLRRIAEINPPQVREK